MYTGQNVNFPTFSGVRCLMMPYIQGDSKSVPNEYSLYYEIIESVYFKKGDIGFLTIDESFAKKGNPHRGARAKFERALHTEAGRDPNKIYCWGGGHWGGKPRVTLDQNTGILLANNIDDTCAIWETDHKNTSLDGDIGEFASAYPYDSSTKMKAGELHKIGILTPHESLPLRADSNRQFLRIISKGVHGREEYFTINPLLS